jgi:hypothetical protein
MPPLEIDGQLLAAAHRGPRFGAPVVALYDADKVQQLASSNWILNDMSFRPKPGLGNAIIESGWQFRERNYASLGDEARELWLVGAMQSGSDDRVNTIRTNQRVSRRGATVGEQQCRCLGVLLAACHLIAEVDRIGRQVGNGFREQVEQIGTKQPSKGVTIRSGSYCIEFEGWPCLPRVPKPDLSLDRVGCNSKSTLGNT